ncbi:MAG TPA: hypothetical protein VIU61_11070 [Kofleriaceae bacterium]
MVRGWLLVVAACSGTPKQPDLRPAPRDAAVDAEPEPDRLNLVSSSVVVEACPDARKLASKQASKEIAELVGPCTRVPGGAAHFSATLQPDGTIHLGSPTGSNPEDGVVPTCVVQHARQLKHKLALTKPCRFDVRLSERNE